MNKPNLRYYKKPKSNLANKIKLLKFNYAVLIFTLIFLFFLVLILGPILASSYYNTLDILPINDRTVNRLIESKKSSFYVKDHDQYLFSKKIDNIYSVPIRDAQENIKLELGNYLDFVFYKIPLSPQKSIELKNNFLPNNDYELMVEEDASKEQFDYTIRTGKTDDIVIFQNEKQVYPISESACKKTLENKMVLYRCTNNFNINNKNVLDLIIKDKEGNFYQIIKNKIITRKVDNNLECKTDKKLIVGENKIECTLKLAKRITIQEQDYDFQANTPNIVVINLIEGENKILVTDESNNNQELNFVVKNDFNLEILPAKNLYTLETPVNLELNIKTNKNAKINITAEAKSTTAGYLGFNSKKIDTDFSNLKFVAKDIEISPESNNSPIVFQIDTKSYDYKNRVSVYPDTIDLLIEVKTAENSTKKAVCKMNIKVTDQNNTPSTCQIVNPN